MIAEIQARERNGAVELPKTLKAGDRVQIVSGLLEGRRGYYASEASHQLCVPKTSSACDAALESPKLA